MADETATTNNDTEDTRAKLRDLDAEIARLRGEGRGLTAQLGGHSDGAGDDADVAAADTNLEETQAIMATLEARRQSLLDRLGE